MGREGEQPRARQQIFLSNTMVHIPPCRCWGGTKTACYQHRYRHAAGVDTILPLLPNANPWLGQWNVSCLDTVQFISRCGAKPFPASLFPTTCGCGGEYLYCQEHGIFVALKVPTVITQHNVQSVIQSTLHVVGFREARRRKRLCAAPAYKLYSIEARNIPLS